MSDTQRGLERREVVRIRLNATERQQMDQAKEITGLTLSSWCRMELRKAAIATLHAAGRKVDL